MAPPRKTRSKKQKCTRKDQISGLPDEILSRILSHLPGDQLIRASLVSKRWNSISLSVPTLDLDDIDNANTLLMRSTFMDSVDNMLVHNFMSGLRKLRLSCNRSYSLSRVCVWIRAMIDHDLEELDLAFHASQILDIHFRGNKPVEFFPTLFTCEKLVSLKLMDKCSFIINIAAPSKLPSLKILHLHKILFSSEDSFKNLIAGCPVLEELDIETKGDEKMTLFIKSSSLRRLRVDTDHACNPTASDSEVVIDAQNIETLDIKYHSMVRYDIRSISSSVKVRFHLCEQCLKGLIFKGGERLFELLRMISMSTKHLLLSGESLHWILFLRTRSSEVPVFPNLEHLELDSIDCNRQALGYLFERLPELKSFVFHKVHTRLKHPMKFQTKKCSLRCLECIELTGFRGIADDLKMVSYFVKVAPNLKILSIQCDNVPSQNSTKILRDTLPLLKVSSVRQLRFNGRYHEVLQGIAKQHLQNSNNTRKGGAPFLYCNFQAVQPGLTIAGLFCLT